ncbi:MAG TPA: hypothetical protein PKA41_14865 [Verrucomicrobiota bacterium]|nr:hypothetical protein [Verrucomicrobiota bacterium]
MKALVVATFNELEPARGLCRSLQQAGIQATINDESKLERFWFMSEPLAAIHVEVGRADFLKARSLIQAWGKGDGPMKDAVRCPECNSSRVEFPEITRKFLMPAVQTLFMALHLMPREYYCQDCQFTWPKVKPVDPTRDILNFPVDSAIGIPSHRATGKSNRA